MGEAAELNFVRIEDILKDPDSIYAHMNHAEGQAVRWETLAEHTALCQHYFSRIYRSKNIGEITARFWKFYLGTLTERARILLEEMFCNIVTFHDIGKHNPNFQHNVMDRKEVEKRSAYGPAGNGHSVLSAVLYLDYYFKRIREIGGEEGKWLCIPLLCHAYVIARHHSGFESLKKFVVDLYEKTHREIIPILEEEAENFYAEEFTFTKQELKRFLKVLENMKRQSKEQSMWLYFYTRLAYSLLTAADYYATSGYQSGVEIEEFGELTQISEFFRVHQNTEINRLIRKYEKEQYPKDSAALQAETQIHVLRNEIFLEAERCLLREADKNIFYLEAPTGSGKSNIAVNLSLQLAMKDKNLKKVFYVYPFNTLVEQNHECLCKVFQGEPDIMSKISVINSVTPIKYEEKEEEATKKTEERRGIYERALLDRQFLNDPMILTTHVSFFNILFGEHRESAFAFHQLAGSIIVLDEIQSYKNSIWSEIIYFLTALAELLHMKIIIMSATLPNLERLKDTSMHTQYLLSDRNKYFGHACFKDRVELSKELLQSKIDLAQLHRHVKKHCGKQKKILIEFITKAHAEEFYQLLKQDEEITEKILCLTGDDSILERKNVIDEVRTPNLPVILVSTQVVEAGVDIDMDIGYKNISKMDSEEQFLGRINRSYGVGKIGIVYFFLLDEPMKIYKEDIRSERELWITQPEIWSLLEKKDFVSYYEKVLKVYRNNYSTSIHETFFPEQVAPLNFPGVCEHMRLINETQEYVSVYLGRQIHSAADGELIDGNLLWKTYKELLQDTSLGYAEKKVKLSAVQAKMRYFIYETAQPINVSYNDQIGDLFYIADGESFFINERLDRELLQGRQGDFI